MVVKWRTRGELAMVLMIAGMRCSVYRASGIRMTAKNVIEDVGGVLILPQTV
jgi:hypothetical protein